jgi:hypothetical protein
MHVQVSSAGEVGGRHLDERHDCEQHGDNGRCDARENPATAPAGL